VRINYLLSFAFCLSFSDFDPRYWTQDIFRNYGVYDIKLLPFHPIFAAATTTGRIVLFHLHQTPSIQSPSSQLQLQEFASHLIFPSGIIIISLSWFPLLNAQDKTRILALTVENGGLYLIRFNTTFESFEILNDEEPLHEHVYKTPFFENKERVWCCAFSSSSPVPNTVFSGGDDNYLRSSTLIPPSGLTNLQTFKSTDSLICSNDDDDDEGEGGIKEKFLAGVTSILPLPILTSDNSNSHTLLIGCYDNHIRLCTLTTPSPSSSEPPNVEFTTLLTLDLGGGVYRLKFLDSYPPITQDNQEASFKVLACCMHAGTKILHVKMREGMWSIQILGEVKDNESMCYAGDVQHLPAGEGEGEGEDEGRICVSSSWADSRLSVWKFDLKLV
jgi:diphthamide biosynthesis protein 7